MHAWFKRPLGAATLACGAELRQESKKGAATVADAAARKKLRRDQVACAAVGEEESVETEAETLGFINAD